MPRIESSKRRYARRTSQRFKAWLIQKNRKARQAIDIICRYFSTFNGSTSYAALTDEIALSGDFEIEVDFKKDASGSMAVFSGANSFLRIDSNGLVVFRDDNSNQFQSSIFPPDTGKHKLIFKYNATTGDLESSVDGTDLTTRNAASFPFTIEKVGTRGSGNFDPFNGQLSDLKIWQGGDRNTGDLILDLPMSEGLKDVYDEVFYRNRVQAQAEWLLNLSGGYSAHQRLWNPDATDPSFSLEAYFDSSVDGTIVAQNVSPTTGSKELQVFTQGGSLTLVIGGNIYGRVVSGTGLFRVDFDGSNYTLFKDGTQVGSVSASIGVAREPSADFRIGARNDGSGGAGFTYNDTIKDVKFWVNGTKATGDLVLDSALDDNSNIIANAASPDNANVWSGTVTATGESSGDINSVNVLSTAGASSQVSVPATVAGDDVLIELTLSAGSLDNIIAGDSSTEFTGWQNIRDSYGQPTNRYKTIMNNNDNEVVFKVSGVADATFTNITARVVEGYGVLQGARNTDYEWQNETPHAIGYDVSTVNTCTTDGQQWFDAVAWNDGEPWID